MLSLASLVHQLLRCSVAPALAGHPPCVAATALRDESPQMLRMQVELIREQGGEAWLSLLNEIQQLEGQRQTRPPPQVSSTSVLFSVVM